MICIASYSLFVREPRNDTSENVSTYFSNAIVAVKFNPNTGLSNLLGEEQEIRESFTAYLQNFSRQKFSNEKISFVQIADPSIYKDHPLTLYIQMNIGFYGANNVIFALDIRRGPYYEIVKKYSSAADLNNFLESLTDEKALSLIQATPHSAQQIRRRIYKLEKIIKENERAIALEDFCALGGG